MKRYNTRLITIIGLIVFGIAIQTAAQIQSGRPRGPEIKFDVAVQSVTITGFRQLQPCDQDLKANFSIVIKNKMNLQSPALSLQIMDGPYNDIPFVITSIDGITQSEDLNTEFEINKINPNGIKTVMGYIPIGTSATSNNIYRTLSTKVDLSDNYEENGNFSELNNADNEKAFIVDLVGQIFPDFKFCDCYPPDKVIIDTSKTYLLKGYIYDLDHHFGVWRYFDFPIYQVAGDRHLHFDNNYNFINDAKIKLKIVNIFRQKGEIPKYRIVFPDGRYLTLGFPMYLTNVPTITSNFTLDESPYQNHYHIYQRNLCVALEMKKAIRGYEDFPPSFGHSFTYSNDKSQLFILEPIQ